MRYLIIILLSASSLLGQGFGESQPFLSSGGTSSGAIIPFSPVSITNLLLWVDIYDSPITNTSGTTPPSNGQRVQAWNDLTTNSYNLYNFASPSNCPIYVATGGPTNGPWMKWQTETAGFPYFGDYLTNWLGGITNPQPLTYFFVSVDNDNINGTDGNWIFDSMDVNNQNVVGYYHADIGLLSLRMSAGSMVPVVYGTVNNDLVHFGLTGWIIWCVQFNGSSSVYWINGVGPRTLPAGYPSPYNPGTKGSKGFVLGNQHQVQPSVNDLNYGFASCLIYQGISMLDTNNIVAVQRYLGSRYGISVP